jgi:hypothetical protein
MKEFWNGFIVGFTWILLIAIIIIHIDIWQFIKPDAIYIA